MAANLPGDVGVPSRLPGLLVDLLRCADGGPRGVERVDVTIANAEGTKRSSKTNLGRRPVDRHALKGSLRLPTHDSAHTPARRSSCHSRRRDEAAEHRVLVFVGLLEAMDGANVAVASTSNTIAMTRCRHAWSMPL